MVRKMNITKYRGGEPKKTSASHNPTMIKTSSMNKHKRRSYKAYIGQGK